MGIHTTHTTRNGNGASSEVLESHELGSPEEVREYVEAEAQLLLGVSFERAIEMLNSGDLDGTAAKPEVGLLRALNE